MFDVVSLGSLSDDISLFFIHFLEIVKIYLIFHHVPSNSGEGTNSVH